jgi:glycosyltransferase involved in cell wall biosynthesis
MPAGSQLGKRVELLVLCQTLPFPPDGGVNIRTYNVLRLLAREFAVTALCFYRASDRRSRAEVEASLAGLREIASVEAFPIPQERNRARFLYDHLRSVITGRPYTKYTYESRAVAARLRELLGTGRFALVHLDSLDLCAYLPAVEHLPVVCVHHNVESRLLHRRGLAEAARWRGWYIGHQARLLEREERYWCPRVALNVAVSASDAETLARIAPTAPMAVVPNGVDTDYFQPDAGVEKDVLFVGGSNWFPNRDARDHFAAEILPRIRSRGCDARVRWVGHASAADRAAFREKHGIEMTGYVDDVRPYFRDAACFVVPLRVGGGTRLKILDAWAMGKAVVSTTVGCEGLEAIDGENILIRDTPADFADAVHAVCADPSLRRQLGSKARATAERIYAWDTLGEHMIEMYSRLARGERTINERSSGRRHS